MQKVPCERKNREYLVKSIKYLSFIFQIYQSFCLWHPYTSWEHQEEQGRPIFSEEDLATDSPTSKTPVDSLELGKNDVVKLGKLIKFYNTGVPICFGPHRNSYTKGCVKMRAAQQWNKLLIVNLYLFWGTVCICRPTLRKRYRSECFTSHIPIFLSNLDNLPFLSQMT